MDLNKLTGNRIVGGAVLAAMSVIVMLVEFPIIPIFPFLKMDLSDVIILFAVMIYGIRLGSTVALIKVAVHWLISGMGIIGIIGDATSLISTLAFVIPIYILYKRGVNLIISLMVGIVSLTILMSILNWSIILPVYMQLINLKIGMPISRYIAYGILPFNLIKGILNSIVFMLIQSRFKNN